MQDLGILREALHDIPSVSLDVPPPHGYRFKISTGAEHNNAEQLRRQIHEVLASIPPDELQEKIDNNWPCKRELGLVDLGLHIGPPFTRLSPEQFQAIVPEIERRLVQWAKSQFAGASPAAHGIEQPEPKTHERLMVVEDDRIIEKNGTRYFPLALAAQYGQVARTTLVDWINAKTAVQGRPLDIYKSATAHKSFLAEESVQRVAARFIKWRDGKPAGATGAVTLGETKDKSGYIAITKAAQKIGVDYHTLWLWATQPGKSSPTEEPLDVIRCTASEQFYIRERDVAKLKKFVPKTGLRRGRRHLALES